MYPTYPERYFQENEFVCDAYTGASSQDVSLNCKLKSSYEDLQRNNGIFRDSENMYTRSWFQVVNLIVGIIMLGLGSWQLSKKSAKI